MGARICETLVEICKIHETLGEDSHRIHETLREDSQVFVRICKRICEDSQGFARLWERICKDFMRLWGDLQDFRKDL